MVLLVQVLHGDLVLLVNWLKVFLLFLSWVPLPCPFLAQVGFPSYIGVGAGTLCHTACEAFPCPWKGHLCPKACEVLADPGAGTEGFAVVSEEEFEVAAA